MSTDLQIAELRGEFAPRVRPPDDILATDFVADVRRVKRWTQFGVYGTILATEPCYYFFFGYTLLQLAIGLAVGLVIATAAIELAFAQIYKLRKRSEYPAATALHLGAMPGFDSACQAAVDVVSGLLRLKGAFLALQTSGDFLSLMALSKIGRVEADRYLRLCAGSIQRAISTKQPVAFRPSTEPIAAAVVPAGRQVVFVPVQSIQSVVIGAIALVSDQSNVEVDDEELLAALGTAVGVSLDNQRQRDELRTLAAVDELTRVYNRHFFFDQLDREISASRRYSMPFSILIFDLDELKRLNDDFGHDVGDQALRLLAQRLVRHSRSPDIVARLGGDEFAVILPHTGSEGAQEIAGRLQDSVEQEVIAGVSKKEIRIAVSCGFACFPEDADDANALLRQADGRMYASKAARYRAARKRRR
jgi:diguanylate cyclase (GGDEF)-like protein